MMIKESITNILRPRTREEIEKELDKISLSEKIDILNNYYFDKGILLMDIEECGADTNKIIEVALSRASRNELINIINELMYKEEYIVSLLIETIRDTEHENIFKKYIRAEMDENSEELNDIVNTLFINDTQIIRDYFETQ